MTKIKEISSGVPENPYLFRPAVIIDLKEETPDVITYTLRFIDSGHFSFVPGQFNMVSLTGIGEAAVSLSSDPDNFTAQENGTFQHTVRAVGNVTKAMARLNVGDRIGVRGPYGAGWPVKLALKDLVVIAGGIGLAPLRPVILQRLSRPRGKLQILYGARDPLNILYKDELKDWEKSGADLLLSVDRVPKGYEWFHHVGLVTDLIEKIDVLPGQGHVFICGPEIMMKYAVQKLTDIGWPPQEIFVSLERRMECGFKICGRCQLDSEYVCQDGPVFSCAVARNLLGTDI